MAGKKTVAIPARRETPAGYSGTPLARKLGIKGGSRLLLVDAPDGYAEWLVDLPPGVVFETQPSSSVDVAQVFVTRRTTLETQLKLLRKKLGVSSSVWISWPKKTSGVPTDVTEGTIRDVCLPLGFVDIKVCAVSDVWSGLKLVVRKELR